MNCPKYNGYIALYYYVLMNRNRDGVLDSIVTYDEKCTLYDNR